MGSFAARAKALIVDDPFACIPDAVAPKKKGSAALDADQFGSARFAKALGKAVHSDPELTGVDPDPATRKKSDFKKRTDTHMKRLGYTASTKVETYRPVPQPDGTRKWLPHDFLACDYLYYGAAGFCLVQVTSRSNASSHRKKLALCKKGIQEFKAAGGRVLFLMFEAGSLRVWEEWQ